MSSSSSNQTSTSAATTATTDLSKLLNLNDFEQNAAKVLPKALYEYISSGTADQETLAENRNAFARWFLRPRVLTKKLSNVSTSTSLLGQSMSMPVFCSAAGVHSTVYPAAGECATAAAATQAGIMFSLSQHATRTMEDVAAASNQAAAAATASVPAAAAMPNLWYQSYILKDRVLTARLVQRAIQAGYQGIFVTVDSVRFGYREADARNGFNALPPPHRLVHYDPETTTTNNKSSTRRDTYNSQEHDAWDQNTEQLFDADCTWDDIRWMKQQIAQFAAQEGLTTIPPLAIKGIMTAEDAVLAVQAGADVIMVSNHGGRQVDTCLAPVDVLPEVVAAVGKGSPMDVNGNGGVPILMDGGVRRGTDVIKAVALGATAVGLGKPMFYALAAGGPAGVSHMLDLLQQEIENAMAICGCATVADITPALVTRHPLFANNQNIRSRL